MTRRRTQRLVVGLVAGGALASMLGLGAGPAPATASAGFVCAPDLQTACAVVFGPLCRKNGCY